MLERKGLVREQSFLGVVWHRKWIIVATVAIFAVVVGVISKSLPKVYSASSTLLIVQAKNQQTFDAVQAAQVVARTYGDLLASDNLAATVSRDIYGTTAKKTSVRNSISISPVSQTQLITITAEDKQPSRAQAIANTYANEFINYSAYNLEKYTGTTVSLADSASRPTSPVRPKPTLYVLIASLLGLAVGLGLAFLREQLDSRLRTAEEIEQTFGMPVLARVPRRGKSQPSMDSFVEAFRVLRTNLQFATLEGPPRTIAVTSGGESDGKTTTVSQLTKLTAATGSSVLAVEADLRRPALQKSLMPESEESLRPGLSNYFLGNAELDDVIHHTALKGMDLIPSGPTLPSLSGALESRRGHSLIADLSSRADLVIFDTPPLALGADAAMVASRVDGVILVVNMDTATAESIRNSLRKLESVRANVLGFVLNRDGHAESMSYGYAEQAYTDRRERQLSS
jgi:polysaccharide biosynthesis transport protein